jgi:AcrR family transcriptional regulator
MSQDRKDRILDVAIRLAEEGGFDNVRQRDVAAQAGVALGTLYNNFKGKEDLLSAALERETQTLEQRLNRKPITEGNEVERLTSFFQSVTRALCRKPNYARATIRAMASGDADSAGNVVAYQVQMNNMIIATIRGVKPASLKESGAVPPNERELTMAILLQQLWFASLVAWSAKLHSQSKIVEQTKLAAELLFAGLNAREKVNE